MKYIYENFVYELKELNNASSILIVPLGRSVEEVLFKLCESNVVREDQVLKGFPHPSGVNVNRVAQLEEDRENMWRIIVNNIKGSLG